MSADNSVFSHDFVGHAGQVWQEAVSSLERFPTFREAAGIPVPPGIDRLDGFSLIPMLRGPNTAREAVALFWRQSGRHGVYGMVDGPWKLVQRRDNPPELLRLDIDHAETHNLADEQADQLRSLQTKLQTWDTELIETTFNGLGDLPSKK